MLVLIFKIIITIFNVVKFYKLFQITTLTNYKTVSYEFNNKTPITMPSSFLKNLQLLLFIKKTYQKLLAISLKVSLF